MNLFTLTSAITTPVVNIPLKILKYESTKHLKPKTVSQIMILNHRNHHNPTPQPAIGDLSVWVPSTPGALLGKERDNTKQRGRRT